MIDKEELLSNKEFYKSFKSGEDLTSFFKQMHKSAVEHMLNAELDAHLETEKHEKTKDGKYHRYNLECKFQTPPFNAVREFLNVKFNYDKDEYNDINPLKDI